MGVWGKGEWAGDIRDTAMHLTSGCSRENLVRLIKVFSATGFSSGGSSRGQPSGEDQFITHKRDRRRVHTGAAAMTEKDEQHGLRVGKVDLV